MTNHVHLLISADGAEAPGVMMKALGQRYVQYVNRVYRRSGALWEGRYRSCPIQEETYLLACEPLAKIPTDKCCAAPLALMRPFFAGGT